MSDTLFKELPTFNDQWITDNEMQAYADGCEEFNMWNVAQNFSQELADAIEACPDSDRERFWDVVLSIDNIEMWMLDALKENEVYNKQLSPDTVDAYNDAMNSVRCWIADEIAEQYCAYLKVGCWRGCKPKDAAVCKCPLAEFTKLPYYPDHELQIVIYGENHGLELVINTISRPNEAVINPELYRPVGIKEVRQNDDVLEQSKTNCHVTDSYTVQHIDADIEIVYEDGESDTIEMLEYDMMDKPLIFQLWTGGSSQDLYWHTQGALVDKVNPGTVKSYAVITPHDWKPMTGMEESSLRNMDITLRNGDWYSVYKYNHDPNVRYITGGLFHVDPEPSMGGFNEYLFEEG